MSKDHMVFITKEDAYFEFIVQESKKWIRNHIDDYNKYCIDFIMSRNCVKMHFRVNGVLNMITVQCGLSIEDTISAIDSLLSGVFFGSDIAPDICEEINKKDKESCPHCRGLKVVFDENGKEYPCAACQWPKPKGRLERTMSDQELKELGIKVSKSWKNPHETLKDGSVILSDLLLGGVLL